VSQLSEVTTPKHKESLHRVLIQVKVTELSLRRKLAQWCLNHKCEREKVVSAVEEYLRVSEEVSSLIGQSELFISAEGNNLMKAADSNSKKTEKTINKTK
jgi:hypothetical protein